MSDIYVPLHCHSDASLDGAGTVESLVARAAEIKAPALGLTDHGTLANAVAFWSACTEREIKPILGIEAYLMYEGKRRHITLLSLSESGFNNLIALDSWSHTYNYQSGYPLVNMDALDRHKAGLYALTGCASSATYDEDLDVALHYGYDLKSIFGSNLSAELMFIGSMNLHTRPIELAERLGLSKVVTNDSHYPCQAQFPAHQAIVKARKGFTYDSEQLWLKSAAEMSGGIRRFFTDSAAQWLLRQTLVIADMAEKWDMRAAPTLPHTAGVEELLKAKLTDALRADVALKGQRKLRLERAKYELSTLTTKGFLDYIWILLDIVNWAKSNDIAVGPGRGSGGGSYLLYLLGITRVDPLEFGLMFERFINPTRTDYPDVDVDFEADRRGEVIEYAKEKWGMVPIATYSTYGHKSAVHDIGRTLAIPKELELPASEAASDSPAFEKFINYNPSAMATYETMVGQIRHRGKHAAGVILPNRPVPIERAGEALVAAWAEGGNSKDLSKIGIVKYDILGLTALSQLKRMHQMTGVLPDPGYEDEKVFDLFCEGDVAGVFQWSGSEGIRELTQRIAPRTFYDLATCNALYRPGALDAGTSEHYPEYMQNPRLLHPRIDPLLEKTYGVICYQEQVMAVVAEVTGGDLSQADVIRRLISKAAVGDLKWEKQMADVHSAFLEQGVANGYKRNFLVELWKEIYTHSRYSFNLSHATTYTMISYQMAWYKVYHRPAFLTSVLQFDAVNAQTYIIDAIRHGVSIQTPSLAHPSGSYTLSGDTIYVPLSDIAYLGEKGAAYLIGEIAKNGPITTYAEFAARIPKRAVNNRAKTMMERIGAFRELGGSPQDAIEKYEEIPIKTEYETQLEILGYIIPSSRILEKIEKLLSVPASKEHTRFAGFVRETESKKSAHGPYLLVHLSPSGQFWVRGQPQNLPVGKLVSGSKNRYGSSRDYKTYRL